MLLYCLLLLLRPVAVVVVAVDTDGRIIYSKQKRERLLARMTGRRIDTDNAVVVVAVTFFFSALPETGAGGGAQA